MPTNNPDQLHIGKDGTPRKCVATPGECPLAHPLAHFVKKEDYLTKDFADRYNELMVEGMNYYKLDPEKDIKTLQDAELVYISDDIEENIVINEYYDTVLYNPIRWQKNKRNDALKVVERIDGEQQHMLRTLERMAKKERDSKQIEIDGRYGEVEFEDGTKASFRFYPMKSDFVCDKKIRERLENSPDFKMLQKERETNIKGLKKLKIARRDLYLETCEHVRQNKELYEKEANKKLEHEKKMLDFMDKRIKNMVTLEIKSSVDDEIETRLINRGKESILNREIRGKVYSPIVLTGKGPKTKLETI